MSAVIRGESNRGVYNYVGQLCDVENAHGHAGPEVFLRLCHNRTRLVLPTAGPNYKAPARPRWALHGTPQQDRLEGYITLPNRPRGSGWAFFLDQELNKTQGRADTIAGFGDGFAGDGHDTTYGDSW